MKDVVFVSAVRTPVGSYMGTLKDVEAYDLAALVLNEVIKRAGVTPDMVDEVIMGQAYQNGEYVNIARMALLNANWPESIPAFTLDQRCCTGIEVMRLAKALIQTGQAEIIVAGGVESMSNAEFYLPGDIKWGVGGKNGMPRGHGDLSIWGLRFYDRIQRARVMSQPIHRYGVLPTMMSWADRGANEEGVTREECDQWSLGSHQKAIAAIDNGTFKDEIVPVTIPQRKGDPIVFDTDETPRRTTTIEQLRKLKPVLGGVSTAGNSSSENDGAAAVLMMSADKAKELGLEPYAKLVEVAVAGEDPERAYRTVPAAVNELFKKTGLSINDLDLIEIQEAFSAQVLADLKMLNIGEDKYNIINVNGSGISLGHPIACTGVRVMVTLLHEMKRRNAKKAMEVICGGGGLGIAAIIERS